MCDAVTGQSDSQAILTSLEQANLFIVPLDNRRQWYRYHQLFADLLRERLSESGRSVAALHARASRWYAENGFHAPAIDHALEADDPAEAVRLIEETAQAFFIGSELTTLTRWWPRLPAELIARHPRVAMANAWAFLATGQPAQAEACLQSVEQAIGSPMTALVGNPAMATSLPDSVAAALAEVTIVRINLAMGELDLARASQLAQAVLPYLEIDPEVFLFNRPDDLRTVVMFTSGLVQLYTGELDAAADQPAGRVASGPEPGQRAPGGAGRRQPGQLAADTRPAPPDRGDVRAWRARSGRDGMEPLADDRRDLRTLGQCVLRKKRPGRGSHAFRGSHPPGRAMGQLGGSSAKLSGAVTPLPG